MKLILAIWLGKLIFFLTRLLRIGGGSAAPGLYALKIQPGLIKQLSSQIPQNIVITGTNGKTTTARILDSLVKSQNLKTIRNSTGSNLERGIASALIKHSTILGRLKKTDLSIWELDEAAFNKAVFDLKPQIIIFLNAFRDQLDRYGEVDAVVKKWQETLEKINWNPKIIVNGSDANTTLLSKAKNKDISVFKGLNIGTYGEKAQKNLRSKADFEVKIASDKGLMGLEVELSYNGESLKIDFPVPGKYHAFDLTAAIAAYYFLNLSLEGISDTLKSYSPAFGRVEKTNIGQGKEAFIFLIKNPAGASLVFQTLAKVIKKNDKVLIALNDNFADGTDVSWIWDAQFELLNKISPREIICSGKRAEDLALRLKYGGFELKNLEIEPDLMQAFKMGKSGLEGSLFILPTYTAMLKVQEILVSEGHKSHYWRED
ncbi:DUF1727 domain-containing protein [Candidatus Daviesbacteria bacterium]|nr:DUF1727 domain-containing protein [Candidatus Daviesbacteria bacterium]